jgi:glycosyltransferase involved in cell wall biosynthesis
VKITVTTHSLTMGGAECQSVLLARGLSERGHYVELFNRAPYRGVYGPLLNMLMSSEVNVVNEFTPGDAVIWWGTSMSDQTIPSECRSIYTCRTMHSEFLDIAREQKPIIDVAVGVCAPITLALREFTEAYTIYSSANPPDHIKRDRHRPFEVVFAGRLESVKNPLEIVRSMDYLPNDISLRIHGSGSLERAVRSISEGSSRITVLKPMPIGDILETGSCVVLASLYEGFSGVLVEAGLRGIPCVTTDCGENSTVYEDGVRGILCGTDAKSIASGILRLYEDESLYKNIGENIRLYSNGNFTVDIMCERYLEVIRGNIITD